METSSTRTSGSSWTAASTAACPSATAPMTSQPLADRNSRRYSSTCMLSSASNTRILDKRVLRPYKQIKQAVPDKVSCYEEVVSRERSFLRPGDMWAYLQKHNAESLRRCQLGSYWATHNVKKPFQVGNCCGGRYLTSKTSFPFSLYTSSSTRCLVIKTP